MADRKYHWAVPVPDPSKHRYAWKAYAGGYYAQACGRKHATVLGDTAAQFVAKVKTAPDWYCAHCAKAALLALAAESPPKQALPPVAVRNCRRCRSAAINPSEHGRTEGVDLDLCDVCYWRKRASAPNPGPKHLAKLAEVLGLDVRDLLPVSGAERVPPPPEHFVDALPDRIHHELPSVRVASSVKVRRT